MGQNNNSVELWKQYNRIIKKDGTIALFASQPFTTKLISSNEKDYRYSWYWLKNQGINFFHAKRMPIRKIEEICIFKKGKYYPQITDGHIPTNSAKGSSDGKAYHGIITRNDVGGKTTRFPTNILEFKCVDNYIPLMAYYELKTYGKRHFEGNDSEYEEAINKTKKLVRIIIRIKNK